MPAPGDNKRKAEPPVQEAKRISNADTVRPLDFSSFFVDPTDYTLDPVELAGLCNKIAASCAIKQALAIIETQVRVINTILPYAGPTDIGIPTIQDFGRWIVTFRDLVTHVGIDTVTTKTNNIVDDRVDPRTHQFNIRNFITRNTTTDGTQTLTTLFTDPTRRRSKVSLVRT